MIEIEDYETLIPFKFIIISKYRIYVDGVVVVSCRKITQQLSSS